MKTVIMRFSKEKFLKMESKYIEQSKLKHHWCHQADGRLVEFPEDDIVGKFINCDMICVKAWCV